MVDSQIGVPFSFKAIVCLPAIGEELVPSFTCCLIIGINVEDDIRLTTWKTIFLLSFISSNDPSTFDFFSSVVLSFTKFALVIFYGVFRAVQSPTLSNQVLTCDLVVQALG